MGPVKTQLLARLPARSGRNSEQSSKQTETIKKANERPIPFVFSPFASARLAERYCGKDWGGKEDECGHASCTTMQPQRSRQRSEAWRKARQGRRDATSGAKNPGPRKNGGASMEIELHELISNAPQGAPDMNPRELPEGSRPG